MATYNEMLEHIKSGGHAEINGWKYRWGEFGIERCNGWWQEPVWPITDEEEQSSDWELKGGK